jgi:hypothetical protein
MDIKLFFQIVIGFIVYLLVFAVRLVLMFFGLFGVALSLAGDGKRRTPKMWRWCANVEATPAKYTTSTWKKWVWNAIRNPLEGLDHIFEQPIVEEHPNPDGLVRNGTQKSAHRLMVYKLFWEYWYLNRIMSGPFRGRYFEFRIGWKFVDGNEDFVPTFQMGPKK